EILMIDETLITKIQLLLLRFGIHANKNKHGNCYRLCIRGENLERFKNIGFTAKDKINRLNSSNFKISRIIPIKWDDVRKFIKKKYNKEIYLKREDNRYVSKNELEWVKKRNGNLFSDIEKLFNINWVKIKEIKIKNKITALEDMETTQHNYIANGLIVHNSPASGCRILAKDLSKFKENVLKYLET
ncbi:MAG: LAGLIDADG family homing endonuclease, partial [Candidatus Aenigmatarchaeota archaeon]